MHQARVISEMPSALFTESPADIRLRRSLGKSGSKAECCSGRAFGEAHARQRSKVVPPSLSNWALMYQRAVSFARAHIGSKSLSRERVEFLASHQNVC